MSSSVDGLSANLVPESYIFPQDNPEEFDVALRTYLSTISFAVNSKDSGIFSTEEVVTGQQFVPTFSTDTAANVNPRNVFRKVINFGVLPNNASKSVAHGITTTQDFTFTHIYATATDPGVTTITEAIPIPYVNVTTPTDGVELTVGPTNVTITTTTANYIVFTRCFVVVEYMKLV